MSPPHSHPRGVWRGGKRTGHPKQALGIFPEAQGEGSGSRGPFPFLSLRPVRAAVTSRGSPAALLTRVLKALGAGQPARVRVVAAVVEGVLQGQALHCVQGALPQRPGITTSESALTEHIMSHRLTSSERPSFRRVSKVVSLILRKMALYGATLLQTDSTESFFSVVMVHQSI